MPNKDFIPELTSRELKTEEWREVADYEGIYSISNLGRVRREVPPTHNVGLTYPRILTIKNTEKETIRYLCATLNSKRTRPIHKMVAEAFLGPRPAGMEINHKVTNRRNNRALNLEYLTKIEHAKHMSANGQQVRGAEHPNAKLTPTAVRAMRKEREDRGTPYRALGLLYGVSSVAARLAVKGITYTRIN